MAGLYCMVNRGEQFNDHGCPNRWRWEWASKEVEIREGESVLKERIGKRLRKIDVKGQAWCLLCECTVSYASRGLSNLTDHFQTKKHLQNVRGILNNQQLPGAASSHLEDNTDGIDPAIKTSVSAVIEEKSVPLPSVKDRSSHLEALTIAFAAEKGLSLSDVPDLIEFVKAASSDKAALSQLSMDNDSSYKLREGLALYLREPVLEELKTTPFSLNIDEATSKTSVKVLAVLVSYFSPSQSKVVVHQLHAFTLTKITFQLIFYGLYEMFTHFELPWENVVAVLMNSCAVMRGSKSGLETLIQNRTPSLLDIDGDSVHHAHSAAKAFCQPFLGLVESLMRDLHTEFHWSTDLLDKLFDICTILGVTASKPERYVPHRWLSVLDVALDTLRLFDSYSVFYHPFLPGTDKKLYADTVKEILDKHGVSATGKASITTIQRYLQEKFPFFLSFFL